MRTCLNTSGRLLGQLDDDCEPEQEAVLLIQAVRINILSKLSAVDAGVFIDIVRDVFPGVPSSDLELAEIMDAVRSVVPSHDGTLASTPRGSKMLDMQGLQWDEA